MALDVRDMKTLNDQTFNSVIDKGLLDSVLVNK